MVKGYCHAHVVELRILHRMAKFLDTVCKKPGFDGGGQAPFEFLINSRIPIGTLFYWVKGAPPHVGFALAYFFPRALSNSLTFLP